MLNIATALPNEKLQTHPEFADLTTKLGIFSDSWVGCINFHLTCHDIMHKEGHLIIRLGCIDFDCVCSTLS